MNLIAYVLSSRLPSWAAEANPFVQPGSLVSLALAETTILAVSSLCRFLGRDAATRNILLAAVVAVLTGDASNDVVLVLTRSQFFAIAASYFSITMIPTFVAMRSLELQLRRLSCRTGDGPNSH